MNNLPRFTAQNLGAALAAIALWSAAALSPVQAAPAPSFLTDQTVDSAVMYPDLNEATELETTPPPPVVQNPPTSWIDPDTGHRVIRLTQEPGSASLYFNVNSYTADGKQMIYTTADQGIGVLDLATGQSRVLVHGPLGGGPGAVEVGHKTPTVYFLKGTADPDYSELWSVAIATGSQRKIAALPRRGGVFSINADETLGAGSYVIGEGEDYSHRDPKKAGAKGGYALEEPVDKVQMMRRRLDAHYPMVMFTVDLTTGKTKPISATTEWLSHLQFSTTDPHLLMYAHQGMWWLVDKQWLIRSDGSHNFQFDNARTMDLEGTGHQWWDAQGNIWYDQRMSPDVGYVAGYNPATGERIWYHYEHNEACIHFNRSPDGTLFCGDGSQAPGAQWIYLFHPVRMRDDHSLGQNLIHSGVFRSERLVNMAKQDYRLEPNPTFTPDQKRIVFRSNMFGATYIFAVEVAKADAKAGAP